MSLSHRVDLCERTITFRGSTQPKAVQIVMAYTVDHLSLSKVPDKHKHCQYQLTEMQISRLEYWNSNSYNQSKLGVKPNSFCETHQYRQYITNNNKLQ